MDLRLKQLNFLDRHTNTEEIIACHANKSDERLAQMNCSERRLMHSYGAVEDLNFLNSLSQFSYVFRFAFCNSLFLSIGCKDFLLFESCYAERHLMYKSVFA